jgi:hypothetical protein
MKEMLGTIVAAHGRHYLADVEGKMLQCVTRGKKTNVAVGDIVHLKKTSEDQAVIEKIDERKTLLYRSDQYKSKLLAANVTRLFIVVATEPSFTDDLVSRALVAAEAAGIDAHPPPASGSAAASSASCSPPTRKASSRRRTASSTCSSSTPPAATSRASSPTASGKRASPPTAPSTAAA